MKYITTSSFLIGVFCLFSGCGASMPQTSNDPVDFVDPYIGNISHMLVPTFPTVHLPNSMLRVYPERNDFTSDVIHGLPLVVTSHRGKSAFNFSPVQGDLSGYGNVTDFSYDHEKITPYYYEVLLDENATNVKYALSHQSAIYQLDFTQNENTYLVLNSQNGEMYVDGNTVRGFQNLENNTKVYLYLESDKVPIKSGVFDKGQILGYTKATGSNAAVSLDFGITPQIINVRYGVSFISTDQAKENLYREQDGFNLNAIKDAGRRIWNEHLSKIEIEGNQEDKILFYTSLYRCFERPVCISEDGKYFSAFDGQVHEDYGQPFYTDDWIWDTYRATHPLRVLLDGSQETDIINSFLLMAKQMGDDWMPTFPEITGDSRRMNSNHAVATVLDAYQKGLDDFDLEYAYLASKKGIEEKTLAPWSAKPAGELDTFYKNYGYIPALRADEQETIPEVHSFEKRQPIAVTLGTSYDQWCLSEIARLLGKEEEANHYLECSYNYRNIFNPETKFFHPKDKDGKFLTPFDYRFDGGMGAREYYGENNGWIYRWDVPHNIADLVDLMGGNKLFETNLEEMYRTPLGRSKFEFFSQLPDHTGNVGQFSMANEPSLHIPYLYNYIGKPWKTQKRIRTLMNQWFRNDLMGVPGDEDGGGMSAYVVFSMMGFYPVTPGMPVYNVGTPFVPEVKMTLSNGNKLVIKAINCSKENKYIQSAKINGKSLDKPWFAHEEIANGGNIEFVMSNQPNKTWGANPGCEPPSARFFNSISN